MRQQWKLEKFSDFATARLRRLETFDSIFIHRNARREVTQSIDRILGPKKAPQIPQHRTLGTFYNVDQICNRFFSEKI